VRDRPRTTSAPMPAPDPASRSKVHIFMEPARSDHNMCFFWKKADLLSDIEQIDAVKHDSFFSSVEFKTKNSKIKKCRVIQ
jgi:hypothetical protein